MLLVSWSRNDFWGAKTNLTRKAIFNPEWYTLITCCTAAEIFVAAWDENRRWIFMNVCTMIFSLGHLCAYVKFIAWLLSKNRLGCALRDWLLFRENRDSVFRKASAFTGSHWNELRKSFSQSQPCLFCNSRNYISDKRGLCVVLSYCLKNPQKEHM